jgi:hypothetical protein
LLEIGELHLWYARREATEWGGPEDLIFSCSDGGPLDPDYLREYILYPVLQVAGIKRKDRENGFHAFRYTAGSILYEITRDIELVVPERKVTYHAF